MGYRIAFVVLVVMLSPFRVAAAQLEVKTQADLDDLNDKIISLAEGGCKDISITIDSGIFYFHHKHLDLYERNFNDVVIRIVGDGSVLVGSGGSGDICPGDALILNGTEIDPWTRFYYARGMVDVISQDERLCCVRAPKRVRLLTQGHTPEYIRITEWFTSKVYKVKKVVGRKIYFVADEIRYDVERGCYDVNYDCYVDNKCTPRFKLFCLDMVDGHPLDPSIHICKACTFLNCSKTSFKSLELTGLHFSGNSVNGYCGLLQFVDTEADGILIHDCTFEHVHSDVVEVMDTGNLSFINNIVRCCYSDGVVADNSSSGLKVEGNTFVDCGQSCENSFCVRAGGESYHISGNSFCDFGYSAICVGVHYSEQMVMPCSGVVENNEIFYSDRVLDHLQDYTLMDSGAIYICTQNSSAIIRENYVHDYAGMSTNHGIFADDGASNVSIMDNMIKNIPNGNCIDMRRVEWVEPFVGPSNVGNKVSGNVVDGRLRIQYNEEQ